VGISPSIAAPMADRAAIGSGGAATPLRDHSV